MCSRELSRFLRDLAVHPVHGSVPLSPRPAVTPAAVIAIDGPAASGKSTTAGAVARVIGARHLDSGALYRGLTAIAHELGARHPDAIIAAARARGLRLEDVAGEVIPFLDDSPAEPRLRTPEVTALVSEVSALPAVREWVNQRLREAAALAGLVVLDGRDIGTAVFPDATVKVFLTATPEARAYRRLAQRGHPPTPAEVAREAAMLVQRDQWDSSRATAPLKRAPDAILLDTTELGFDQQVEQIVALIRSKL